MSCDWCDVSVGANSVRTCPVCLPRGAITWLIENGRQLELFDGQGVLAPVRGLESIEKYALLQVKNEPDSGLPF